MQKTVCNILCGLSILALAAAVSDDESTKMKPCPKGKVSKAQDWSRPSIFDDLSEAEMTSVERYMMSTSLGVHPYSIAKPNSTYIMMIERHAPNKTEAINYLDGISRIHFPYRFAKVSLVRGDIAMPVIEEYKVGPLPHPTFHELLKYRGYRYPIPYHDRPLCNDIERFFMEKLIHDSAMKLDSVIRDITDGFSYGEHCRGRCLTYVSGGMLNSRLKKRNTWVTLTKDVEGHYLHPIGIQLLLNMQGTKYSDWKVDKIWSQGHSFDSVDALIVDHESRRSQRPFYNVNQGQLHTVNDTTLYSALNRRGKPIPDIPQRGPESFMPDGRRFTVKGHHVEWLGWDFDYNIHTTTGPQAFDIRLYKQRIVYEISVQEMIRHYSGYSAAPMHQVIYDGGFFLGLNTNHLVPGVDCPSHAIFMDFVHYLNGKPVKYENSACVFEHKGDVPLRRHYQTDFKGGYRFAQGMADNQLIVRSAMTIENADYIVDYIFRQNGAVQVRMSLSGYLMTNTYSARTDTPYAYQVAPQVGASMNVHLANFKVDMDVQGTSNRFATLNIGKVDIADPYFQGNDVKMNKFVTEIKRSEQEAAYKYDFEAPKYLLFYNDNKLNRWENRRAYRLVGQNFATSMIPEDYQWVKGAPWVQYQVAVTRHHDDEETSSTVYSFYDAVDPVVNLQNYIDDNEDIIDQDLVAWVTLGLHDIPSSENVPLVMTTGNQMSFLLTPYNYFDEDPSMASRDNVRMTRKGNVDTFDMSGNKAEVDCAPFYPGHTAHLRAIRNGASGIMKSYSLSVMLIVVLALFFS